MYTKAYFIEVVIMQVRSYMSDLMRIANPIIRCKQTLFGIGSELDFDAQMRFVWITICCISAALAALNVDERQGEMVQQVDKC